MSACPGGSASAEVATSDTESKNRRWLWRSESKVVIAFTASLVKPALGAIELVWGFFFGLFSCLFFFFFFDLRVLS